MRHEELEQLVRKFLNNTATAKEQARLADWYKRQAKDETEWLADVANEEQLLKDEMLVFIQQQIGSNEMVVVRNFWPRIVAAASIIVFVSIGTYFVLNKKNNQQLVKVKTNDIRPGGNRAILTLANGKQIVLGDAKNGTLAKQGAITINKTRNGQVVYKAPSAAVKNPQLITYNAITTPRGGQYHLTLADGTNVWLNAASSIKYPVAFTGNERRVEITGEVYFEVKHNAAKPFRVISNGQTVEDIGTHFDINAYADEQSIKTTLVEGAVKVSSSATLPGSGRNSTILKPGQQSSLRGNRIAVQKVDIDNVIAWKDGQFNFNNDNLGNIMHQVSRWYNVEVVFEDEKSKEKALSGIITRFANVSDLLQVLERTGEVKFKINGHKIIVLDK